MRKIVLAAPGPLLRSGLLPMLDNLPVPTTVVSMDPASLDAFTYLHRDVDLLILGVGADAQAASQLLLLAVAHLQPRRVLVLCPPDMDGMRFSSEHAALVYGCVASNARPMALAAALHLGLDLDQDGDWHSPERTAAPAPALPVVVPTHPPAWRDDACLVPARPNVGEEEAKKLGLTPRQYALLSRLAQGLPIKAIAIDLGISPATAKGHASTLYQRLGARNMSEAVYMARLRGARLAD